MSSTSSGAPGAPPAATPAPDPLRLFVMIFVVAMVVTVVIIWLGINGDLGWGIPGTSHGVTVGFVRLVTFLRGSQ
ncbi:MAG: hypothetical protein L3K03_01215 [Thermoplasmata archaeon]|nr:hypothetical protein [Thermoplasmata archaeon]